MKKRGIRDTHVQNFREGDYYVSDKCDERNALVLTRNVSLSFFYLSKSHSLTLSCRSQSRQTSTKVMFFKFRQLFCLAIFELHATPYVESTKIWVVAHCRNRRFDFDISRCLCTSGRARCNLVSYPEYIRIGRREPALLRGIIRAIV